MSQKQLFFEMDFDSDKTMMEAPSQAEKPVRNAERGRTRRQQLAMRRAVLRWLESDNPPTGLGTAVVTRIQRLRADVAAFWSIPVTNRRHEGPVRVLTPAKTAIVQCYLQREECWPDCIRSQEILPELTALKARLAEVEGTIREHEPELRERDALFEEYAEWRYDDSGNRRYHQIKRSIEKLEHGLYHGTKFERIRSAQLADYLYLAVPDGVVKKTELADGWGLIWIDDALNARLVADAEDRECLPSNRLHLVQNIAAANKPGELMVNGIAQRDDDIIFTRPVYRRRAEEHPRLSEH